MHVLERIDSSDEDSLDPGSSMLSFDDGEFDDDIDFTPMSMGETKPLISDSFKKYGVLVVQVTGILAILFVAMRLGGYVWPNYVSVGDNDIYCLSPECIKVSAELLLDLNTTVDPCEDFETFVCDGFYERHSLSAQTPSVSQFRKLHSENLEVLLHLLTEKMTEEDIASNTPIVKSKIYYETCSDEDLREDLGVAPLKDLLKELKIDDNTTSKEEILALMHKSGIPSLFQLYVSGDDRNPDYNALHMTQKGLGLGAPTYYTKPDVLGAYMSHIATMFTLVDELNGQDAVEVAKKVATLEAYMSQVFVKPELKDSPIYTYNIFNVEMFTDLVNNTIDFEKYFSFILPEKTVSRLIVETPVYYKGLGAILSTINEDDLRLYLKWSTINAAKTSLTRRIEKEALRMHKILTGAGSFQPKYLTCIAKTDTLFGFAVGRAFVDRKFSGASKSKADEIIENVVDDFKKTLTTLPWMSESTKKVAIQKATNLVRKIGYPDLINDDKQLAEQYDKIVIDRNSSLLTNDISASRNIHKKNFAQLGEKVDRLEWGMTPSTVNAYYNPNMNEIVFPAGILQSPFFNEHYPKSMNYGGFGVVAGHELTHAYDNSGRNFDQKGNYSNWWTEADEIKFNEKTKCFIDQYSSYCIDDGNNTCAHVNGNLTLGENLADNGGIARAHSAYEKWVKDNGKETPLPGLDYTHDQLFFINFGRVWCNKARAETAMQHLAVDPHSPPSFRILGTLSNFDKFSKAFSCKAEDKYVNEERCQVW